MARLFSSGFELQSISTAFKEFDRAYSDQTRMGSISTSIKRTGTASYRINGNIATGSGVGIAQDTHSLAQNNRKTFFRAYVLFESFPSVESGVMGISDDGNFANALVMIKPNGTATYYWNDSVSFTAATPASSTLNLHQWYRFEISLDTTTSTSWSGEFRIDGVTVATFSGANGGNFVCAGIQLFSEPFPSTGPANNVDQYYDDLAANDANGSFQNTWPGEGSIIHLKPDASGDNNAWLKGSNGAAGDANNFQNVDELNPDDATTYLKRTSGTPIDDYNCEPSGLDAGDTIKVVQVGARIAANSNTQTARDAKLRIKGQAGGTVQVGSTVFWNTTVWFTHYVVVPATYSLTSYTNPQGGAGAAWTSATLDTMQIGMQPNTSSANEIRVSTLWALVDYVPGPTTQNATIVLAADSAIITNPKEYNIAKSTLPADSIISADTKWYPIAKSAWTASSVLAANTLWYPTAKSTWGVTSVLAVTTLDISKVAVLQATGSVIANARIYTPISASFPLTSSLDVFSYENYATLVKLSGDSLLLADTLYYLIASANLPTNSTLTAKADRYTPSLAEISAFSDILVNSIQSFNAISELSATSSLTSVASQNYKANSDLMGFFSIIGNIGQIRIDTAESFPIVSSLVCSAKVYKPASASLPITSVLSAKGTLFERAAATLPATSSWSSTLYQNWMTNTAALAANSSFFAEVKTITISAEFSISSTLSVTTTKIYTPITAYLTGAFSLSASTISYGRAVATLGATAIILAGTYQKWVTNPSVIAATSSLSAMTQIDMYVSATLQGTSTLSVSTKLNNGAFVTLDGAASVTANTRWAMNDTSVLALTSTLNVSAAFQRNIAASLPITSDLLVVATLSKRDLSATLNATSTLLVKAMQLWKTQASYNPTSDVSLFTNQWWASRPTLSPALNIQVLPVQKMFEKAKLPITSQCRANSFLYGMAQSKLSLGSTLRANTIIHLVKNHNKTKKHLRGDVEKVNIKAGLAEEVEVS